jgi:hypothetical protein
MRPVIITDSDIHALQQVEFRMFTPLPAQLVRFMITKSVLLSAAEYINT